MSDVMDNFDEKRAYPNIEQYMNIPGSHNTQKWLQAVKEVYYGEKNGLNRNAAINKATSGWNIMEVRDFVNWLRFYEEGTHLKYKTAQSSSFYYGNADIGYLLPIKQDPPTPKEEHVSGTDVDSARDAIADELSVSEKKRIVEKQRHKIIGRLDSAEKLLRSQEGQLFADKEFASLLEAIYDLKKKIQTVNKRSTSTRLYDDLIVRQANILSRQGFVKAAELLYSLAEDKPKDKPEEKTPSVPPPAPPAEGSGTAGGLPSIGPGSPDVPPQNVAPAPAAMPAKEPVPKGIADFLQGLEGSKLTPEDLDKNKLDDTLEVMDVEDDLFVEAQATPPTPPAPPIEPPPPLTPKKEEKEPLEVKEEPLEVEEGEKPPTTNKDFDSMINTVFANLTIADVVAKFEDIAKFYKTREMPRQLAFADMMLDSLGLAPFFPTLSEATNKALEANNYISTRIEDILSKLRGTMKTRDIDVKDEGSKPTSPEIDMVKQNLKEQGEKEDAKKQMRKDLEEKSLKEQMKETPEIEVEEDLGGKPPAAAPPPPATLPV